MYRTATHLMPCEYIYDDFADYVAEQRYNRVMWIAKRWTREWLHAQVIGSPSFKILTMVDWICQATAAMSTAYLLGQIISRCL